MNTKSAYRSGLVGIVFTMVAITLQSCGTHSHAAVNQPASENKQDTETQLENILAVPVTSQLLKQEVTLPAELMPFRDVRIHAKVKGFVSDVKVDRGSYVKSGQVLIVLTAPELDSQISELKAKLAASHSAHMEALSTLESSRATSVEIKAKLESDKLTLQRLRQASKEPGAIAQNEVDIAQKSVEGDAARLKAADAKVLADQSEANAKEQSVHAAESSLRALENTRSYLVIRSPLDGVITERWVHEGDIAGVELSRAESARPLLRLVQSSKLRLVVSVPEADVSGVTEGMELSFTVPAYPGKKFSAVVKRIGHTLDVHTRTMPVELDVDNRARLLEPGMYASVKWHYRRPYPTMFIPVSAVGSSLENTFVVRITNSVIKRVPVTPGITMGTLIEVFSQDLSCKDEVILKASEDYVDGEHVTARLATQEEIAAACKKGPKASGE